MILSHVIKMPDLSKISIPEKQRHLYLNDEQIFRELRNEYRRVDDAEDGARKGDYVLIETDDGLEVKRTIQIELGGKAFWEYSDVLAGCRPGQELHASVKGREILVRVKNVRRPVELPLTDESIAALSIPGVNSLVEYRLKFIKEHGGELLDRVFRAIQHGLMDQVLGMAEIYLDPAELKAYNEMQLVMVGNISGNADERLMKAYGDGEKTLEECKQLFFEENKRMYSLYVWGKDLAAQDGAEPTEADRQEAIGYYCLVFNTTEEEADLETALMSYYLKYGIGRIKEYYKSVSDFSAEGIENYSLS